jgi:hypothetical protein
MFQNRSRKAEETTRSKTFEKAVNTSRRKCPGSQRQTLLLPLFAFIRYFYLFTSQYVSFLIPCALIFVHVPPQPQSSQENVLQKIVLRNTDCETVFSKTSGITGKCAPNFLMLPSRNTYLLRASSCHMHNRDSVGCHIRIHLTSQQ